jgi:hypothetical protein
MDLVRLVSAVVYAYFIVATIFGGGNVFVNIALYMVLLITVVYATEVSMALSNARIWYNVMVVSIAMAIPQTVFALNLALNDKPIAAWVDTLGSTLVDAILVTAVVRRHLIGSPLVRSPLVVGYMLLWSIFAVGVNILAWHPELYTSRHVAVFYVAVGFLLPVLLVKGNIQGFPSVKDTIMLANNALATFLVSLMLSEELIKLHIEEVQLGIISTILATLPDFIVGMMIRGVVSRLLSAEAGDKEVLYTMLAAATHDQLTVPGLIMLYMPSAMAYYPHLFNIAVILLKFTLLDRRAFWLAGLPLTILIFLMPPV